MPVSAPTGPEDRDDLRPVERPVERLKRPGEAVVAEREKRRVEGVAVERAKRPLDMGR
jgi:hypothetical protein